MRGVSHWVIKCRYSDVPTSSLQDLTRTLGSISEREGDNLIVSRAFDLRRELVNCVVCSGAGTANVVENDEGPVDTTDGVVADPGRHPVR